MSTILIRGKKNIALFVLIKNVIHGYAIFVYQRIIFAEVEEDRDIYVLNEGRRGGVELIGLVVAPIVDLPVKLLFELVNSSHI